MDNLRFIIQATNCKENAIVNVLNLLDDGATIPFISRYRKEKTGGLDEVQIQSIKESQERYDQIIARQKTIKLSIQEQGKLTNELLEKIDACFDIQVLEDLYLPFKQKRKTKGDKARELGLEPLAKMIMSQRGGHPEDMAQRFVKGEISSEKDAIDGAIHIMAEWMNENAALRAKLRMLFQRKGVLTTKPVKGKETESDQYRDYLNVEQAMHRVVSHRFLAIYRAAREGVVQLKARPTNEEAIEQIQRFFVKGNDDCAKIVELACVDAYKRLLLPALENELIGNSKEKADADAIAIFSKNLRQLLLAPPLGNKRILAIDPGFRTGCKVVCISETGALEHNETIFPHPPQKEESKAKSKLSQLVQSYAIEAIAIGDGTAGRETERLVKHCHFDRDVEVYVVREDGASIYSASSIARKEFPNYDVTVRGAVSIGRRLMDPLAELVKIDPKSVGVGQYQHEVDQKQLKDALDQVVISSVNSVGVDVNTASPYLLEYISGFGSTIAENIVKYRTENGEFAEKKDLLNVPRLGQKAYEQAAGFLRITNGVNPLDNSSIHPESYNLVDSLVKQTGSNIKELIGNTEKISQLEKSLSSADLTYTLKDILDELKKPGRDPRKKAAVLEFDSTIKTIEDLKIGMELKGIVTNVTAFGAFVNIGIKENGLIHKSNLSESYVSDPTEVISLHEHVNVQVIEIDVNRKRIGLKRMN